ncbi:MAG: acetaldehyde dehydrogenase (acetylating) [Bacillota bacterium]|nr:acetaldehyde dehydrogenase (acetylating) [Bacillota bacterium]
MEQVKAAIIGPGNIGSDLMYKVLRSRFLKMELMAGIVHSEGIERAEAQGIRTTTNGITSILEDDSIKIVFDATGAKAHLQHAPLLKEAGKIAIDLTPAAVGPYVIPAINLEELSDAPNLNLVTCGGQSTVPIVYAIQRVAGAKYAEIVATISSKSAGPGTRQNIDEFTETTTEAICSVGKAKEGKAIIILNPAEPPIMMTNTIYVEVENPDEKAIVDSVTQMVQQIQSYVPGYHLRVPPIVEANKVTVIVQVRGAGDYLPAYSGNLDIITAAATAVGDRIAARILGREYV